MTKSGSSGKAAIRIALLVKRAKWVLCLVFLGISMGVPAQAQDFALALGLRNTNADSSGVSGSITAQNGLQFGAMAFFGITDQVSVRSGFLYSQRYYDFQGVSETTQIKTTYLDIPVTVKYKFSDYGGVFGGIVLGMNQSKSTSAPSGSGQLTGVASTIVPITFGLSFKFHPNMGGEFFYEMVSGKVADTVENVRSLGANFLIYFE